MPKITEKLLCRQATAIDQNSLNCFDLVKGHKQVSGPPAIITEQIFMIF
tara:strand:- start:564 stop:710 length:147 start_codon:yes stop_codon:yes gene_type:complete